MAKTDRLFDIANTHVDGHRWTLIIPCPADERLARAFYLDGIRVEDSQVPEDVMIILYSIMDGLLEGLSRIEP